MNKMWTNYSHQYLWGGGGGGSVDEPLHLTTTLLCFLQCAVIFSHHGYVPWQSKQFRFWCVEPEHRSFYETAYWFHFYFLGPPAGLQQHTSSHSGEFFCNLSVVCGYHFFRPPKYTHQHQLTVFSFAGGNAAYYAIRSFSVAPRACSDNKKWSVWMQRRLPTHSSLSTQHSR